MDVVVASRNSGKISEFEKLFSSNTIHLLSLATISELDGIDIPETAVTFIDNAVQKADYVVQHTPYPVLADDSGLSVAALDGFPGVKSARWKTGTDLDRNKALLAKFESEAQTEDRSAQFTSVLSWIDAKKNLKLTAKGIVKGRLSFKPQGSNGFGYDSIFIPNGESRTFAQLGQTTKNQYSHRAQAVKKLSAMLEKEYGTL